MTFFIVAVFRFFTISCFLKHRHNPCWSVRTLDQYSYLTLKLHGHRWIPVVVGIIEFDFPVFINCQRSPVPVLKLFFHLFLDVFLSFNIAIISNNKDRKPRSIVSALCWMSLGGLLCSHSIYTVSDWRVCHVSSQCFKYDVWFCSLLNRIKQNSALLGGIYEDWYMYMYMH